MIARMNLHDLHDMKKNLPTLLNTKTPSKRAIRILGDNSKV